MTTSRLPKPNGANSAGLSCVERGDHAEGCVHRLHGVQVPRHCRRVVLGHAQHELVSALSCGGGHGLGEFGEERVGDVRDDERHESAALCAERLSERTHGVAHRSRHAEDVLPCLSFTASGRENALETVDLWTPAAMATSSMLGVVTRCPFPRL